MMSRMTASGRGRHWKLGDFRRTESGLILPRDQTHIPDSRGVISRAVRRGTLTRINRSVYFPTAEFPPSDWEKYPLFAHSFAAGGRLLAGNAAAAVVGLWRLEAFPTRVETYCAPTTTKDPYELPLYSAVPASHYCDYNGALITIPARTVVDLYRLYGHTAALISLCCFMSRVPTAYSDIVQCARECRDLGIKKLDGIEDMIALTAPPLRLDSALEAIFYAQCTANNDFRVTPQASFTVRGRTYRVDFRVNDTPIVVELDGKGKYGASSEDQAFNLDREKRRSDALYSEHGLIILRFGYRDVVSGEAYRAVSARVREFRGQNS